MGSLPPERANIGSAVNDTTRELGGALGVADRRQHHVVAVRGAARRPTCPRRPATRSAPPSPAAPAVADAAREAFVDAMSRASIVVAAAVALGALIAWRYLPAGVAHPSGSVQTSAIDGS